MSLFDELEQQIEFIFSTEWDTINGQKIPEAEHVKLGNHSIILEATVLYADLTESTELVDNHDPLFAAEIYKSYLHCASKLIKKTGGVITAFDGDRVMGVFIWNDKNSLAVECALKINQCVNEIINPAILRQYGQIDYHLKHCIGVDTSEMHIARTGVRGSNDLVWVGRAANYAAKLCSYKDEEYCTYITEDVFEDLVDYVKFGDSEEENMWERSFWKEKNIFIYGSNWSMEF